MLIISSPHFVSFIVFSTEGKVRSVHPPLEYMLGWSAQKVALHCKEQEDWTMTVIQLVNHHEVHTPC